ncbi:alpha/beta hydrolase [Longibacter salinarum]|uniref:Alpha/beta hydrolase n=1 Tax=Longibacter salinarum TaxID=1850348 RepID=A0A2A8CYM8_9BACT|nr:alpha/beta fold hydrolase [Longibacter salinarum]PEN13839.1 alpha/beta hydrolase [Longibacter salinarum]
MPDTSAADHATTPPSDNGTWSRIAWGLAGAAGTYAAVKGLQAAVRGQLPAPSTLPPALSVRARAVALPGGQANYYHRPGNGTPIVFVHSFNAAASSFEMAPIFEYWAENTDRPLYVMDWLGFGRSDRPNIDYTPDLYHSHLFAFLRDVVETPADLVALSLGCEYAASIGMQAAPMVRRLVLLHPTGLGERRGPAPLARAMIRSADASGLFELFFYRLTRTASLRDFYERQVFLRKEDVPDALVDYAHVTSHARGAHHAPRRFVDGSLFLDNVASDIYARLYRPTLLLTPADPARTVQQFDMLPDVLKSNERDLSHRPLPGGLLPHWEHGVARSTTLEAIEQFLTD